MNWKLLGHLNPALGILCLVLTVSSSADPFRWDSSAPPDPLRLPSGAQITNPAQWRAQRRPELLALFAKEMYGQAPPVPDQMSFQTVDCDREALGGRATRKQVTVQFGQDPHGPRLTLLLYIPNSAKHPTPAFLGLNFWGNHAIHPDPRILITTNWMEDGRNPWIDLSGVKDHRATEACRGTNSRQWPIELILERGFALVTAYRGDLAPDFPNGMTNGVHALYPSLQGVGDNFSTMGAWAWGLSRALDYLTTDRDIDAKRVVVFGWSRLGKAALWAAARDERFAAAISIQSGAGGAKLFRRGVGEDIRRLNTIFPHWYCANFRKYMGQDTQLPFDQHEVISLIAPRPVYIASAAEDSLADPDGEFSAGRAANAVYRLLGFDGLPVDAPPPLLQPVMGRVGYHVRPGGHDVTVYDWTQFLLFAQRRLGH